MVKKILLWLGLLELVTDENGVLSTTRLAQATGYFMFSCAFVCITIKQGYQGEVWAFYAGVCGLAVFHGVGNKVVSAVSQIKGAKAGSSQS